MAKPPFMDIRDRALARLDAGGTMRYVAKALSVALLIGVKWSERLRATESAAPGRIGGQQAVRRSQLAGVVPRQHVVDLALLCPLTIAMRVVVRKARGFMALSLQVSTSEAMVARLAAPTS